MAHDEKLLFCIQGVCQPRHQALWRTTPAPRLVSATCMCVCVCTCVCVCVCVLYTHVWVCEIELEMSTEYNSLTVGITCFSKYWVTINSQSEGLIFHFNINTIIKLWFDQINVKLLLMQI